MAGSENSLIENSNENAEILAPPEDSPPPEEPPPYLHLPTNVLEQIFSTLGPKDLALASGVAQSWYSTALQAPWQAYYASKWPLTPLISSQAASISWHRLFSTRMTLARSLKGRPQIDRLPGHNSGVKCIKILPESNLLLSGSVDRRLSLWDLDLGTQLASSLLHAGTVRCIAVDSHLLATGCSDHRIRVWRPINEALFEGADAQSPLVHSQGAMAGLRSVDFPFRVEGARTVLAGGHSGPVSALQLAPTALFSGSWDYCVRVWDRSGTLEAEESGTGDGGGWPNLQCVQVYHFDDWVTDMSLKNEKLFVAAGREAHVLDARAGGGLKPLFSLNRHGTAAAVTAIQGSEDGKYLFYSTAEGGIYACDVRAPSSSSSSAQQPGSSAGAAGGSPNFACSSAVTGLSWDYPWLSASLQNGEVLLVNAETVLMGGGGGSGGSSSRRSGSGASWPSKALSSGLPGGTQCVDLASRWLVAGYESGGVVSWDFSRAEEAERAAEALRLGRKKARERRRAVNKEQKERGGVVWKRGRSKGNLAAAEEEGEVTETEGDEDGEELQPSAAAASGSITDVNEAISLPNTAVPALSTDTTDTSGTAAVTSPPMPIRSTTASSSRAGRVTAPSLRVPGPVALGRSPGGGSTLGADGTSGGGGSGSSTWQVLRMNRSNSSAKVTPSPN